MIQYGKGFNAWFNDCVLVKSGQIEKCDGPSIQRYSIYARLCLHNSYAHKTLLGSVS